MKKLTISAIVTIFMLIISKVLGFSREMLLAYKYGTNYINDAYAVAISLPSVLFTVVAGGLSQSYIPIISRIKSKEETVNFFNNVVTIIFIISSIVTIICYHIAEQIVTFMAPGFDYNTRIQTINFVKIIVWMLPLFTTFTIMCSQSQYMDKFIMPNFCDYIIVNLITIFFIMLSSRENIDLLVYGHVIAMFIAELTLYLYLRKAIMMQYKPYVNYKDPHFILLARMGIPLGICVMANQVNSITDKIFSSSLGEGVTSALGYANRIQSLFLTLITTVFLSLCYPRINKLLAEGRRSESNFYIKKAYEINLYLALPFMLVIIIYAKPIVSILFERGAFNSDSSTITAECLRYYAIGILFYAFGEIASKVLASNLRQKIILKNTLITVGINILLDYILIIPLEHKGLALATSIAGIISFVIMQIDIIREGYNFLDFRDFYEAIKIIISALVSVLLGYCVYIFMQNRVPQSQNVACFISIVSTGVILLIISHFFHIKIYEWIINKLLKKSK